MGMIIFFGEGYVIFCLCVVILILINFDYCYCKSDEKYLFGSYKNMIIVVYIDRVEVIFVLLCIKFKCILLLNRLSFFK